MLFLDAISLNAVPQFELDAQKAHIAQMNRDDILRRLKAAEGELRSRGVAHAALFGSVARGEAGPDSDIDIMVEMAAEAESTLDLYAYLGIVHAIEDLFPARVDVANRKRFKPFVQPSAERDAVYAF